MTAVAAREPAVAAKPRRVDVATSPRTSRVLVAAFVLLILILWFPIVLLVIFSFNQGTVLAFPFSGFTLDWYRDILDTTVLVESLRESAKIGLVSSTASIIVGLLISVPLARRKFRGKAPVTALMLSPLVVPHLVFSIALLILFRFIFDAIESGIGTDISLDWWTLTIGHVVVLLPIVVLILVPRLQRIDNALEEAAHDLGASGFRTFRSVILPLVMPALFAAYLITFISSFNEFIMAVFISGRTTTFPLYVFGQLQGFSTGLPTVVAATVIVVAFSLIIVGLAEYSRRRLERRYELTAKSAGMFGTE